MPPAIAPLHVVVVPIFKTQKDLANIKTYLKSLFESLDETVLEFESAFGEKLTHNPKLEKGFSKKLSRKIDEDDHKSPGRKFNERELKGVPIVIAVGPRDMQNGTLEVLNRIKGAKETITLEDAVVHIPRFLYKAQNTLLEENQIFRKENTVSVDTRDDFEEKIKTGFVLAHRDGSTETENIIQEKTKATIRCIPFDQPQEE